MKTPLIQVDELTKSFFVNRRQLTAVKNLSFTIEVGQTLGLVGESGCGKSTLGRLLTRLYEPDHGKIIFRGQDITRISTNKMKNIRQQIQMIFQDPFASLNPRMTVDAIISEPLIIHGVGSAADRNKRVAELLDLINLPNSALGRFPHEFSGGQRQRIGIARALALHPEFIVCDEPISALDVSIQAQIANLLLSLQKKMNLTYLFIAHDLAMVKILSSKLAVMYLGEFVEIGSVEKLFKNPQHPYTQVLIASVPLHDPISERNRVHPILQSEPPSLLTPLQGCSFCSRCPNARSVCFKQKPPFKEIEKEHAVACFL